MKAFLINPEARTITEVEYDGDYRSIYKLCGYETFDVARFGDEGDAVYVDDNGLLVDPFPTYFFSVELEPGQRSDPLAGNGLVLGCDDQGDSTAPRITLEQLRASVWFYERFGTAFIVMEAA